MIDAVQTSPVIFFFEFKYLQSNMLLSSQSPKKNVVVSEMYLLAANGGERYISEMSFDITNHKHERSSDFTWCTSTMQSKLANVNFSSASN